MQNVSSSNSQAVNVPKLRFPGFEGEWKREKLRDFTERVIRKNKENETELPLTISSKDGLVDQITYFNKQVSSKDMSGYYLLKNGEFAYNKSYSVGFDFGSIKRLDRYPMGALSTLYICFALKKHNSDFMKTYFDSLKWYKEIYMIAAEGARNHGLLNVPTEDFFNTTHILPQSETEQKKIAKFLLLLDERITKQQQLIDSLKLYKRGVSEAIFNKKYKFDCDDSKWDSHTMNNLGTFYNGLSGKGKNDFGKGNAKFITYMNVYKNPISEVSMCETVQVAESEKQNKVKYGDVLFSQSSETLDEIGMSSVWLHKTTPYLNSFCFGFRFDNPESIYPLYIAYYMRSHKIRRNIMREGQGATRINLSAERMKGLQLELPTIKIQKKIGDFLYNLDNQILCAETILKRNNELRKSLLQKLFL